MSNFIPPDYSELQKRVKNEKGSSYWGGYYKPGIYGGTPTQKKSFSGRILPMFDYTLSQADPDFNKAWAPYRNADKLDQETGQPVLSAFFGVISCYTYLGTKQASFLSPSTRRFSEGIYKGHEVIDPIADIRNYARKSDDPAVRALTEKEENKKDARMVLPFAQTRYVFNFYGASTADRVTKNYVLDLPKKGFEDLASKLGEWRPAHEKIADENWPHYLFGDITDPNTGLAVDTVSLPGVPQPFNGFILTPSSHKSLKGTRVMPVTEDALLKRAQFYGDTNVFKIYSAQEIIDYIVEDADIPYYLIEEVCSGYANIPPQPKKGVVYSTPEKQTHTDEEPAYVPPLPVVRSAEAPPPPPKSEAPPPPPPPKVVKEVEYWVTVGVGNNPVKYKESEVQGIINNTSEEVQVCKSGDTKWVSPEQAGFVSVKKDAPSPPSSENTPPWDVTKVTNTSPSPVIKKSDNVKANTLTPEQKAELDVIEAEFTKVGNKLDLDKLSRMVFLRKEAGFAEAMPS